MASTSTPISETIWATSATGIRYSTCDVTYAAGCRGHVTRLVTTTWNNQKIARDAKGKGGGGGGKRREQEERIEQEKRTTSRTADDRPFARSLVCLYGTYLNTCSRESTTGFTFENTVVEDTAVEPL